jgi:hypothetical protein
LNADERTMGKGEEPLLKINSEIVHDMDTGIQCSPEYLDKKLKPLLELCISKTEIWEFNSNIKESPAFRAFLRPNIYYEKSIPNPYFNYALTTLLNSKRYKDGGLTLQQETCAWLVSYLSYPDRAKYYKDYHQIMLRLLFQYFHNKEFYTEGIVELIERTIAQNNEFRSIPHPCYLLLLWIIDKPLNFQVRISLQEMADTCNTFNRKNLTQWLALVLLAKDGEEKYLNKLVSIVKQTDNSMAGIQKATYMFPYLSMVQKPEIVELMKTFLRDEKIIDQGADVINRHKGLSSVAAETLYIMLDDYVKFSSDNFNQTERKKCLDWFEKNPDYKYRKINYWDKNDKIIQRMRYMIFEVN